MTEPVDWGDLFARYQAAATRFAEGLVGDAELASDLFQEAARATYQRAATEPGAFAGAEHARNYLFRALRNLAIDARAGRRRSPGELEADPVDVDARMPLEALIRAESRAERGAALRAAFSRLPAREQEVLVLRYLEGLSYKDIAARTGRPISTLHARVDKGLARLRLEIGIRRGAE